MASVGFLIGGDLINALAFSGSNFLFSSLFKESIDKERKRHDKAIEDLQRTQVEWAKKDKNDWYRSKFSNETVFPSY